jgi:hypothetical protein
MASYRDSFTLCFYVNIYNKQYITPNKEKTKLKFYKAMVVLTLVQEVKLGFKENKNISRIQALEMKVVKSGKRHKI